MLTLQLFRFGCQEGRILSLLWRHEELTASDMVHLFDDARMTRDLVTTNLDKLHLKKLVMYRRIHGGYYYRAAIDRHVFVSLLQQQLSDFLGADGANLLNTMLKDMPTDKENTSKETV